MKLEVYYFLVADRIHASVDMDDIRIIKAAEDMQNGVSLSDVCEELVT